MSDGSLSVSTRGQLESEFRKALDSGDADMAVSLAGCAWAVSRGVHDFHDILSSLHRLALVCKKISAREHTQIQESLYEARDECRQERLLVA